MQSRQVSSTVVLLALLMSAGTARADNFERAVHYECDPQGGHLIARLYTVYEYDSLPKGDHWLRDLGARSGDLSCRLSDTHTVTLHAAFFDDHPREDALQVFIDGQTVAGLSVDGPLADPMDGYAETITIDRKPDHDLAVTTTIYHNFK